MKMMPIPPTNCRIQAPKYDKHLYQARHVVENLIGKLKWFRRLATRFDKIDAVFLAFLHIGCSMIWLR